MENKRGDFVSKSTMKVTATETTKKVELEIPEDEQDKVVAGLIKVNHLRGLYEDFCIINQEFLHYVMSLNLSGREYKY